jgi:hypothetical protein
MICTHRIRPDCRISRFLVAPRPSADLLFCAKHLFVAARTRDMGCKSSRSERNRLVLTGQKRTSGSQVVSSHQDRADHACTVTHRADRRDRQAARRQPDLQTCPADLWRDCVPAVAFNARPAGPCQPSGPGASAGCPRSRARPAAK